MTYEELVEHCRLMTERAILAEEDNERLRDGLRKYGEHDTTCSYTIECNCGFADLLGEGE